jgi:hypothetical protein
MSAYDQAGVDDTGEPQADDPMTAEEMNAISEERLQDLGESLAFRRDIWVAARRASKVEKRWLDDIDQYNGRDVATKEAASMMDSVEAGFPVTNKQAKPQRSTVFVNITRPKSNTAEARLANMLLPSDDRNWGLLPTPDPKLTNAAMEQAQANAKVALQQPAPAQSLPATQQPNGMPNFQAQLDEAVKCAKSMQNELDDQLIACDFNGELRKVLHDCAMIGTGIIKGPIVVNRVKKAYRKIEGTNVFKLEIEEDKSPASERVDPWDCFPDPSCGEDIHNGIGIFEKRTVTSRQLRELTKQPGYLKAQISMVLEEGPNATTDISQRDIEKQSEGQLPDGKDHFQLWEYWGEFLPEDLRSAGVNVPDGATESISGCVIMVNKTVIKGFLNPIETGDIPYDFMVWEKVDGSCFGYGVPHLMRPAQRVLNAAWRQLMDNSGLSVGPQIVVDTTAVVPADQQWQMTGRKIWYKTSPDVKIADAFGIFEVSSHSQEIQQIIDLALKFADEESSVPMMAQGEKGTAPDTVGGMTILMNSSNVVLGRMVKQFDDMVTRPHIRRYYDWYMAYGSKDECKGDYQVDARGTTALLVKDMANQAMLQTGQFASNGVISPMVNWEAWFKQLLKMQHIDPTEIMKTDSEIAALSAQPAPPPIQLQVEQARGQNAIQAIQAKGQADLQVAAQEASHEQQLLQTGGTTPHQANAMANIEREKIRASTAQMVEASRAQAEMSRAEKEQQIAQQNGQFDIQKLQLQKEIELLKYATQERINVRDVQAQLATSAMDNATKKQLAAAEIELNQSEGAHARNHEAIQGTEDRSLDMGKHLTQLGQDAAIHDDNASREAMQPSIEPGL